MSFFYKREQSISGGGGSTIDEIMNFGKTAVCKITYHDQEDSILWEGTGFWFNRSAWIFTCKHVLEQEFGDGTTVPIKLEFLRCEFYVGHEVISFRGTDFDDYKTERAGNVDFAVIKLKRKPETPHGKYADITIPPDGKYENLSDACHGAYVGECPLSFSSYDHPEVAQFDVGNVLEFCFVGFPSGREVEQGPIVVYDRRPIHSVKKVNELPSFVEVRDLWVKGGLSGSPVWCKLSTNIADRWTLVGIISEGDISPYVGGLHYGPTVLAGDYGIFSTCFTMKDGGILDEMKSYCLRHP